MENKKFNCHILDHVMQSEDYATIKNACEGRGAAGI